ncbi:uncharacterized protein LOC118644899 [Monomorium pharaonis]|uniref:uncharacterized protein LOC118644899 n=1 Tax=Monomorium pharaonis TaxID=307658 RepID=UPI001745FA16|nr:uncharacterized protein LOC118644899 [Monomorium pharaonis]
MGIARRIVREKKRVLVSTHIDAILDIKPLPKATSAELSKLIDDVRQHLRMLETLQIRIDERIIVRILERSLAVRIRNKWEDTLALDELPDLKRFYKFLDETAFRLCTVKQDNVRREETSGKRRADSQSSVTKARRVGSGTRALVLNTPSACVKCKGDYPLYKCFAFGKLNTQQRWDFTRQNKLCRNCLRAHVCNAAHCKLCPKFHHSLLHSQRNSPSATNDVKPTTNIDSKPTQSSAKAEGTPST